MTLVAIATIALLGAMTWARSRAELESRLGGGLQRIVTTAALAVDGDAHRLLRTMDDTARPEFTQLREQLRRVQTANRLPEDLLYTVHIDSDMVATAAVMLQETPYTGTPYTVPDSNRAAIGATLRDRVPHRTALYTDAHGTWISAFAPILDVRGEVAGLLMADVELTDVQAALREEFTAVLLRSWIAVVLAMVGSLLFGRRLEAALTEIRAGAEAIEAGAYNHRIALDSRDELGLVARQFNRMAAVLSERFEMLKFLPEHTVQAVQRRAEGSQAPETERVDAAVFFSDIRGYTAMSEGLSDERVVAMLNLYLRRQAELIEVHGGTIDKFIGDAVLAVFQGHDRDRRAVLAGLQIQAAVAAMNADGAFERAVRVGIGIAAGSLVFGEIGSDERRERTLIGSTVNLASRLCSHAGEGEVVVSERTRAAVPELVLARSERVALKGFAEEAVVHVVAQMGAP